MNGTGAKDNQVYRALKALALRVPAIRRLVVQKVEAQRQLALLDDPSMYAELPGATEPRYALLLDYPPSREMRARWGYSRPPIPQLLTWFESHAEDYRAFIADMRGYGSELRDVPYAFDPAQLPMPAWTGVALNPIDGLELYTFIRKHRPATFLEIGSGTSTCFAHLARQRGNLSTRIVSIDPKPRAPIDAICDHVVRSGLETCDLSIFESLVAGDIIFMDGSHRCFMNSDVTVFFIDVLPMLKAGVIVQIHDIALPWDYHQSYAKWHWSEQYLLATYLMASRERIDPLFPAAFVTAVPAFAKEFETPLVDQPFHLSWGGGGSMWFTHKS